jgi:hypothetical protein
VLVGEVAEDAIGDAEEDQHRDDDGEDARAGRDVAGRDGPGGSMASSFAVISVL